MPGHLLVALSLALCVKSAHESVHRFVLTLGYGLAKQTFDKVKACTTNKSCFSPQRGRVYNKKLCFLLARHCHSSFRPFISQ